MISFDRHIELGWTKLRNGDFAGALTHADAALALEAAAFPALELSGRAQYLLGRVPEALAVFRQAFYIWRTTLAISSGAREPAEEWQPGGEEIPGEVTLDTLEALHERQPLDVELLAFLAGLAEDHGRFPLARNAFEELVGEQPDNLDAWEGLVHVTCLDDLDAGQEAVRRALIHYPKHPLFYEYQGYTAFRRRNHEAALQAFRLAIEYGGDVLDNHQSLAQCYLANGDADAALAVVAQVTHAMPNEVAAHRLALDVAMQADRHDVALQHAHQLVRLEPTRAETYADKAHVEIALGEWAAAERTLTLGFHKAMDGVFALYDLVEMLISEGDLDHARLVAELAYTLAPSHPESSAARGKVLREIGEFDDALTAFKKAAALAPTDDVYQTWIGVVLDNMGDYQAAIQTFNKVLAYYPADVWTLTNRGLSYLAMDDADRALADFSRACELDPEDATTYFWRACAQVKLGDTENALQNLRRAVDLSDEILPWLEQEPTLDPIRTHPRFRELQRPAGF